MSGRGLSSRAGALRAMAAVLLAALAAATPSRAGAAPGVRVEDRAGAFARVVVDAAELRSGPGVSFRVVQTVPRGATLPVEGRAGSGYWLRVTTEDGRAAFVLGDEVETFAVREDAADAPARPGFFAPPPLEGARAGLAILAGVLVLPVADGTRRAFGYMEARPALVVHPTLTLEGFVGATPTSDGSQVAYGGGATIHLAPSWAVCPYVGLAFGGLTVRPNADSFVLAKEDVFLARAGGGALLALRNRILVRLDATHLTLFRADANRTAVALAAGLGVYF